VGVDLIQFDRVFWTSEEKYLIQKPFNSKSLDRGWFRVRVRRKSFFTVKQIETCSNGPPRRHWQSVETFLLKTNLKFPEMNEIGYCCKFCHFKT
jgi:hypothetical protein